MGKKQQIESATEGNSKMNAAFPDQYVKTFNNVRKDAQSLFESKLGKYSKLQLAAVIIPLISSIILLLNPVLRWNIVLFFYMPTMSGLYLQLEWLFEPMRQTYLNFEYAAFPHLFEEVKVAEILAENYSYEEFVKISKNLNEPVVIRGLFKDSVAYNTFGTDEWVDKYNDFKIQTIKDNNGSFKYSYEMQDEDFKTFMYELKQGNSFKYGYGLDEIYATYPHLVDDLELQRLERHNGKDYNFCQSIALFITGSGTGLRWHNANHANFGMMLHGSKIFHILNPKYSMFMGPSGNTDPFATGFAARSPKEIIDKLPETQVKINAGDVIFLPPWYWHAVETFGDDDTGIALLNTCRFSVINAALKNNPVLELYRHTGFINWLHPKIPIIARFVPFFRVIQDGFREYFSLMPHWDAPDCYSSKRKACEKYFNEVGWEIVTNHNI